MASNSENYTWPDGSAGYMPSDQGFSPYTGQDAVDGPTRAGDQTSGQDLQRRGSMEARQGSSFGPLGTDASTSNTSDSSRNQDYYTMNSYLDQQGRDFGNRMEYGDNPRHARSSHKKKIEKQLREPKPKGHNSKREHKHHHRSDGERSSRDKHGNKSSTKQ